MNRIGRVSKVNYEAGTVRVTYPDRDGMVTDDLPVASLSGEYRMPAVGDEVFVAHLSNNQNYGVVIGRFWDKNNVPAENGKGLFRKELGTEPGAAYIKCEDDEIVFHDKNGDATLADIISALGG